MKILQNWLNCVISFKYRNRYPAQSQQQQQAGPGSGRAAAAADLGFYAAK